MEWSDKSENVSPVQLALENAPDNSLWLVSGAYPHGGSFTDCTATVLPRYSTDGHTLLAMLGGCYGQYLDPKWVWVCAKLHVARGEVIGLATP